jgi:hypothetical protein
MTTTISKAREILKALGDMLEAKNQSYGDSAADPLRVFARGVDAETGIRVRIDDKLSRLARGSEYPGDDTILDLAGCLVLLLAVRGRQSVAEDVGGGSGTGHGAPWPGVRMVEEGGRFVRVPVVQDAAEAVQREADRIIAQGTFPPGAFDLPRV